MKREPLPKSQRLTRWFRATHPEAGAEAAGAGPRHRPPEPAGAAEPHHRRPEVPAGPHHGRPQPAAEAEAEAAERLPSLLPAAGVSDNPPCRPGGRPEAPPTRWLPVHFA